jgi:uncharacterized protein with ParB-like and HNH nuclease domain
MVNSILLTLDEVISEKYFFNIPIYQRLYVWGKEQIQTLLSDIWDACDEDKDVFYLGGTLVIERTVTEPNANHKLYDLIDGQQRFTTLWLISIAWEKSLADFRFEQTKSGYRHRIAFAIRPQVKQFFDAEFSGETVHFEETCCLQDALKEIRNFPNNRKQEGGDSIDLEKLTRYIREKVKLVFTKVPDNTDLNKLFEVINNRGVQLQHHEILKAKLLSELQTDEQERYAQLWDACSYMNDYVEKNLRITSGLKIIELFDFQASKTDEEELADASKVLKALKRLKVKSDDLNLTLAAILESDHDFEQTKSEENIEDYPAERVRSIISFPMLLQHVLRIFLAYNDRPDINKILDKDLISIFENYWLKANPPSAEEVKAFIELLWDIRYRFDKHIIKWVEVEGGEVHAIRHLRINKSGKGSNSYSSLMRDTADSELEFALLQSMLYHSQQMTTHYWLTPLLYFVWYQGPKNARTFLQYLDNYLLCAFNEEPLVERTRWFLDDFWCFAKGGLDVSDELNEKLGTNFAHYWFYKLEFILWYQMKDKMGNRWKNFRMTAKNSVEHISPQNPTKFDSNKVSKDILDSFGNLSLVSRSINSEYSNKPYTEKRARFIEKNREIADSLKMDIIYKNETWNDDLADAHQQEMINVFSTYFDQVDKLVKRIPR